MLPSFYVGAAQHMAGLTIKMNRDQQPVSAPNTLVNKLNHGPLPITINIVHSIYTTRDNSCIPRIPVRHEPEVVCVRITSGQHVRQTIPSRLGLSPAPPSILVSILHNTTPITRGGWETTRI